MMNLSKGNLALIAGVFLLGAIGVAATLRSRAKTNIREVKLDDALADTFPASDPLALTPLNANRPGDRSKSVDYVSTPGLL
ncbi:hypothetical protein [Fimbriimonas ginsengisoli]|uniref:Uncharacterized protein n=1 Tax=Fimbriimonas ginsengisoli Gsoil 348 TaxID=661478 RepID=A0A068NLP3_FIMGI|nr:hypothetical protein [Fimbriimonas ginsengisoli]AIE83680.1 hypothetical protein OP10G_0312 [Fimbriimonas ginsengisoli Gsoil 348]